MRNIIQLDALDRKEALRYLGYGENEADARVRQMLDECEKQLLLTARPQIVYRCFDIERRNTGIEVLGTSLFLTGESIQKHLEGCEKAVLLCATISSEVDRLLRRLEVENMAAMVVADSLSSVAVEQVCDKAEKLIAGEFDGYYQTWRFGIGYGDLPLTLQEDFLKALDAGKRVGVYATKSSLLTPRKSVTCIIGLSKEPIPKQRRGCQTCNMKANCRYRASGTSCNS